MQITFPAVESIHGALGAVSFPAVVGGQQILCRVSYEALQDNFGCDDGQPLECFRENRSAIENKARQLLEVHRFEADGSLLIRSADGA